jgi:adenylate cyclase
MTLLALKAEHERPTMPGFHAALTREILATEQLRIKAVLATILLFGVALTVMHLIFPESMERIWRGQFELWKFYVVAVPLVIFEVTVLWLLKRHIALNHDVPVLRRYLSALIETSLPTIALAIHMNAMGPEQALGFAAPLAYFVFIILSTLRLDFWLSTFTGLVAAVELFAMAMLYHPVGVFAEAAQEPGYNIVRSILLVVGGVLAGAVGLQLRRQVEASIAASTARDRVTNLSASTSRRRWWNACWRPEPAAPAKFATSPSCSSISAILPGRRGCARRRRWSTGSTACLRCWSISWTAIMAL